MWRTTSVLTLILACGAVVQMLAGVAQAVDVTGAWAVTITKPSGSASGLADPSSHRPHGGVWAVRVDG